MHFSRRPFIYTFMLAALASWLLTAAVGVFMPSASQDQDGNVTVSLGAKGVLELELIAGGEAWGRGPAKDFHSSFKAMVDSPA